MKPLLDLQTRECRYPEPGNLFCAAATDGHSYCPTHRAVCCDRVAPSLESRAGKFRDIYDIAASRLTAGEPSERHSRAGREFLVLCARPVKSVRAKPGVLTIGRAFQ